MDIAFAAIFVFAAILTFYAILSIEDDLHAKSWRPIFVLVFAAVAWLTTIALLNAPVSSTVFYPAYSITAGTSNVVIPSYNVIQTTQTPLPVWGLNEYDIFAGAMATMCFIMLVMYMLGKGTQEIIDEIHGIGSGK